jgi:hypothetical protein
MSGQCEKCGGECGECSCGEIKPLMYRGQQIGVALLDDDGRFTIGEATLGKSEWTHTIEPLKPEDCTMALHEPEETPEEAAEEILREIGAWHSMRRDDILDGLLEMVEWAQQNPELVAKWKRSL